MADEEPLIAASPVESVVADAAAIAEFVHPHEKSAEGGRAADRRGQWSWALFEAARDPNILFQIYIISPFFATVMIRDPVRGQELWGDFGAYSGYLTVALTPFFGAIADKGGPRKPWLALFAALMVVSFAGTWVGVPDSGALRIAIVGAMVVLNNVVFEFSNAFHGAMLSGIAPHARVGGLSGLAFALGNASGVVLLSFFFIAFVAPGFVHSPFLPAHPLFGVDPNSHEAERLAGPISAIWMLALAMPLFLFTPDRGRSSLAWRDVFAEGIASVIATVRSLRHYRNIAHYLGARSIFNDGMTGVLTFAGIYAAGTFHLGALEMTIFGIELCVFATLGGLLGGWLDDRVGSRRAIFISIGGTALSFALALTFAPDRIFWFWHYSVHAAPDLPLPLFNRWPQFLYLMFTDVTALCITAGYANSRTMMARLAPPEKMTEFFGLMSLSGTATTFFAPVAVSRITYWTHSQRGGMIAIVALLIAGLAWMTVVRDERATVL